MKVLVFGGGPTGLSISDKLLQLGYEVELHEKSDQLGGCWKVTWQGDYFSEHAPRVITTDYHNFYKLIDKYKLETSDVYGGVIYSKYYLGKFIYKNLSFTDLTKFFSYMYIYNNNNDNRTVEKWMKDVNISKKGRNGITKLSLDVATHPKYLSFRVFMRSLKEGSTDLIKFVNLKSGDLWVHKYKKDLEKKGLKIFTNSKLKSLKIKENNIVSAVIENDKSFPNNNELKADHFVLSMPLYALRKVLKSSHSPKIKNNWMEWSKFEKYVKFSTYSGIGFVLHFKEEQQFPPDWCGTCMGDWSIIMIHTSKHLKKFSKDRKIKDVYSCVIVDTETKSKIIKKSADECETKDEIMTESLRQLSELSGYTLEPDVITFNKSLKRYKNHWYVSDTAFAITPKGTLKQKGKIDNLFSVGPHNLDKIAILENAFISSNLLIEDHF